MSQQELPGFNQEPETRNPSNGEAGEHWTPRNAVRLMARQVALNLKIKQLEAKRTALLKQITQGV